MLTLRSLALFALPAMLIGACSSTHDIAVPNHPDVTVVNLGQAVNSDEDDYAPALTDASRTLIFTSNRRAPDGSRRGDDFWKATRQSTGWNNAAEIPEINSDNDEGGAYITPDGATVYFVECWTKDGFGDADIYTAKIAGGKWEKIRNLGKTINTKYWESMPYLSPDGTELYFSSDRPGGYGGTDLYVSKLLRDGNWGPPKNLGPEINTAGDEKSPVVSPGGDRLYFSSNGHGGAGGMDIFVSRFARNKWSAPVNAGTPINSPGNDLYFVLSPEEDSLFISSDREGGMGRLDLWVADHNPFKDTTRYEFFVAGRVIDTVAERNVSGALLLCENLSTRESFRLTSGLSGNFRFKTRPGSEYAVKVSREGYHDASVTFKVPEFLSYSEYRRNIPVAPIVVAKPETAAAQAYSTVYFDFDKSEIRPDAAVVLDSLLGALKALPAFSLQLDAHTDDWGTEKYNWLLSRSRGASVSRYLSDRGVPVENIAVTPHGELQPASENADEAGRQKNRRVEIRVERK